MREPLPTDELDTQSFAADPLTEAIRRADLAALWRAIAELPRQQRDALLLREFGGLSYDELAEALAVTGPAVESLLFRARQGVRARLQTAYATLSGVGWVETLLRLLAGASSSAAPVAAKAVVVAGVGAAVATGGVVVAPQMFDHQRRAQPQPAAHAPRHLVQAVHADVVAPLVAAPRVSVAAQASAPAPDGGEGSSSSGDEAGASRSGDERHTLASGRNRESGKDSGDVRSRSSTSTGDSGSGSERSDNSGGSGDGGDSGGSSRDGGGDQQPPAPSAGLTLPVPNPAVTVATLPGVEPPSGDG